MKKGFTLIELLVVVLIIGVLSAVALPMYNRSIERARFVEAQITMKAIGDAFNRIYLEDRSYNAGFGENSTFNLDITIPDSKYFIYAPFFSTDDILNYLAARVPPGGDAESAIALIVRGGERGVLHQVTMCIPYGAGGENYCKTIGALTPCVDGNSYAGSQPMCLGSL